MSCLVSITVNNMKTKGTTAVLSTVILTKQEYEQLNNSERISEDSSFLIDNGDDLHEIMDTQKQFTRQFRHKFSNELDENLTHEDVIKAIIDFKNVSDWNGNTVAHLMVCYGNELTFNEIFSIGNPSDNNGKTLAHLAIELNNMKFSFDEILALGNPQDSYGNTLAHLLIKKGVPFTENEIEQLGNPSNSGAETLKSLMDKAIEIQKIIDFYK